MSHFTTIKVQISDGEILQQSLQELGYAVQTNATVRGYQGDRTQADYVIACGDRYDLGFRKRGETYEAIADFWALRIDAKQFLNQVTQKYAHNKLLATVQSQGFSVETEEVLADGTVRVVVGRWA